MKLTASNDDIEERVAAWHAGPESAYQPLHDYLGMTEEQYAAWVEQRQAARPPFRVAAGHWLFGCSPYAEGRPFSRRCRICGKRVGW